MSSILSAFATSVALPLLTAVLGAVWKALAKPGFPSAEDWALALELLLAAVVVQMTYVGVDVIALIAGSTARGTGLALACRLGLLVVIGGFAMPVFALWLKVSYAAKPGVYVSQLVASVWSHAPMLELPVGTARNTTLVAAVMLSSTFLLNYFLSGAVGG